MALQICYTEDLQLPPPTRGLLRKAAQNAFHVMQRQATRDKITDREIHWNEIDPMDKDDWVELVTEVYGVFALVAGAHAKDIQ